MTELLTPTQVTRHFPHRKSAGRPSWFSRSKLRSSHTPNVLIAEFIPNAYFLLQIRGPNCFKRATNTLLIHNKAQLRRQQIILTVKLLWKNIPLWLRAAGIQANVLFVYLCVFSCLLMSCTLLTPAKRVVTPPCGSKWPLAD